MVHKKFHILTVQWLKWFLPHSNSPCLHLTQWQCPPPRLSVSLTSSLLISVAAQSPARPEPELSPAVARAVTRPTAPTLYHSSCLLIRLIPLVSGLNEEKLPPGGVITIANWPDHKQSEGKIRQRFCKSLHLAADCNNAHHCLNCSKLHKEILKIFILKKCINASDTMFQRDDLSL